VVAITLARTPFTLVMFAIVGTIALLLGILGIYGVISYGVSQRNGRVTLSDLIDEALKYARIHNKSVRDYECKAGIVRKEMGARVASEIKPQEIDTWLSKFKTKCNSQPLQGLSEPHL
jgi:hypothetical protein